MTRKDYLTPPTSLKGAALKAEIQQIADSWGIQVTVKTNGNRCTVTGEGQEFECMRWDVCRRVNELGLDKMLGQ